MKRFLLKIGLIISWCVCLIIILNFLFTNNSGHYTYMTMLEMYNCEDNIDTVFLGSSHVYGSYDVELADSLLGETTFNAGSSGQLLDQSYYLLREICKTNQVKKVYLDTVFMISQVNSSKNQNSVYLISDYMKLSLNKIEYLYQSGGIKSLCNGLVTVRRNLTNGNILDNIKSHFIRGGDYSGITYDNAEYRGKGFIYSFEVLDKENADFESYKKYNLYSDCPMSEFSYRYLIKIIEFCQLNEIELVLVDQPMPKELLENINGYGNYADFLHALCKEYNIAYMNFNLYKGDIGITIEDFRDEHHLNGQGAEKYTKVFCDVINHINHSTENVEDLFEQYY